MHGSNVNGGIALTQWRCALRLVVSAVTLCLSVCPAFAQAEHDTGLTRQYVNTGSLTAGYGHPTRLTIQGGDEVRMQQHGPGNFVIQLGGPRSIMVVAAGKSGKTVFQANSSPPQLLSQYSLGLRSEDTDMPAWSGANLTAFTPLFSSLSWTGTNGGVGPAYLGSYIASKDAIGGEYGATLGSYYMATGGKSATGSRQALAVKIDVTDPTGNSNLHPAAYSGAVIAAEALASDNGIGLTPAAVSGALNALNTVAYWGPKARNWSGGSSIEADVEAQTGSSLLDKVGILISSLPGDASHGRRDDAGLAIDRGAHGAVGFNVAISLGRQGSGPPVPPNGTLIKAVNTNGAGTYAVNNVMDFRHVTAHNLLLANGFEVDGRGAVAANSYSIGKDRGVSCKGPPTAEFTVTNGIVTHC